MNLTLSSPKVNLLGINIDNISVENVLLHIQTTIDANKKSIISYVNIHALNLCCEIDWFYEFINSSQLVFCDGYGVHVGALLTGQKLDHRFTPPDWIDLLCQSAIQHDWGIFFLGAKLGVAEQAARQLKNKHTGLKINVHDGYFDHFGEENQQVLLQIQKSKAKIIVVGMGMPLQERWIKENFEELPDARIFLPVGAMFDYVASAIPRGPRWLTDNGFEWLARLFIEPKRLWRRYLVGNPVFFIRLIIYHLSHKDKLHKV